MTRSSRAARVDVDALKREHRLADVIASYGVALKREGAATFRALCPFHQEHTPSFWVDARDRADEHYWCFGQCGAHGDVITFVMEQEGCSFVEACERLGARQPPSRPIVRADAAPPRPGRSWEHMPADSDEARLLDWTVAHYQARLEQSERALAYLHRRAVSDTVAHTQRLGYADGQSLLQRLLNGEPPELNGSALATATGLGLVVERPSALHDGAAHREFLYDRLIVPELRSGAAIWCIGRSVELPDDPATGRARPKYLGLPGAKPLLGLEQITGSRAVFLTEGPFDWLAALGWGLPAFAVCGTHFPGDRLPSFAEAEVVYGVFDPDRAGQSAAERFAGRFGSRWRPVRLPNSLDLAELAALGEPGRELFRTLVGRARAAAWQSVRF